jgi:glutamine synthetase
MDLVRKQAIQIVDLRFTDLPGLEYKWKHEVDPVRLRPHPWEFQLYFDT